VQFQVCSSTSILLVGIRYILSNTERVIQNLLHITRISSPSSVADQGKVIDSSGCQRTFWEIGSVNPSYSRVRPNCKVAGQPCAFMKFERWESKQYCWRDSVENIGKNSDKIIDKVRGKKDD
jgi:hypothetical protein